jgi:uncharacterized OB-fold protein
MSSQPEEELVVYKSSLRIPYRWAAGLTASQFYRRLAQEQKLYGTRCSKTNRVLFPPRKGNAQAGSEEWVEVGPAGTVTTFTIVHYPVPTLAPSTPPIIYALIQLDGADTAFIHQLSEVEIENVKTGMRVTAVFAEKPSGNITDIQYFKPL